MIQQEGLRMLKNAYSTLLPFDPIFDDGLSGAAQAPSPFPRDARGRPVTMLHAYYRSLRENPLSAMPTFEPSDAYWHAMLLRSQLQQQYQGLGGVMRPVDLYRTKLAAEHQYDDRVDPILLHPMLAAKPKTLDELGDRRYDYMIGTGAGATLGALGGHALGRALGHGSDGAYFGALGGAALGIAATLGKRFLNNVSRHEAAARDFEARKGPLPFAVKHPYITSIGTTVLGGIGGSVAGAALAKHFGQSPLQGALMGGLGTKILIPALGIANQQERDAAVKRYIDPARLRPYGPTLASAYQD
jgi:hypothetical protein